MNAQPRTRTRAAPALLAAAAALTLAAILALALAIPPAAVAGDPGAKKKASGDVDKVEKTDKEWQAQLTPEQYQVTRCSATERPFTGKYWDHHEEGVYLCVGCGQELFSSRTKYESGSGWPSYFQPVDKHAVDEKKDISLGMMRTEVVCSRCEAHLGHVFEDGPRPTGLRYCINSAALDFRPDDAGEADTGKTGKAATPADAARADKDSGRGD